MCLQFSLVISETQDLSTILADFQIEIMNTESYSFDNYSLLFIVIVVDIDKMFCV